MQRSNFSFREKSFFSPNKQTTKCYVGLRYIKIVKKKFSCTAWKEKGEDFLVPWNNPKAGHKNQSSSEPNWEAVRPAPRQIPVTRKPGCRALRRCRLPRLRTQPARYLPWQPFSDHLVSPHPFNSWWKPLRSSIRLTTPLLSSPFPSSALQILLEHLAHNTHSVISFSPQNATEGWLYYSYFKKGSNHHRSVRGFAT